jgi:type II secretory ATPase GspE/PulE/Tfp pilus assembly ATPase PilB-like protein
VFEVMAIGQNIRQMVAESQPAADVHQAATASGMLEFRRVGLVKVAEGVTTTEEILRVLPVEQLGIEG